MLSSLLYVSRSSLQRSEEAEQLEAIRGSALTRNVILDVTGFLVVTPTYFAQYLEGAAEAVDGLMASIKADARHHDLRRSPPLLLRYRLFPSWRMTCFPSSSFISSHVEPLVMNCHAEMGATSVFRLIKFVWETAPEYDPTVERRR